MATLELVAPPSTGSSTPVPANHGSGTDHPTSAKVRLVFRDVKQGGFVPVFLALNCGIEWRVKKHDEMPKQVAVYSTYVRPLRLLHVAGTLVTC